MSIHENYNHTLRASYIGYISQAIVNNFAPLLFLTFQKTYGISLDKITLLVTMNFAVQLLVDFLAAGCVDGLVMEAVGIGSFSTDAMKNTAGFKRNSMGDVAAPDGALHMRQRSSRNKSVILINGSAQGGI